MNRLGSRLTMAVFGESHGPVVGAVVDGFPAGLLVRAEDIQAHLDRRRPGLSDLASPRQEPDEVEVLSGVRDDRATGAPIQLQVRNRDADPDAAFRPPSDKAARGK